MFIRKYNWQFLYSIPQVLYYILSTSGFVLKLIQGETYMGNHCDCKHRKFQIQRITKQEVVYWPPAVLAIKFV